jgi:hypothetical protein
MTVFEFVFGLFSIVLALGLTHLLAGFAELIRNAERVRFSAIHALWMWTAFALTIGNWASLWAFRTLASWPAWSVLLLVLVVVTQYVVCALVTPDTRAEGRIDLVAFHEREHRRYLPAFAAIGLLSIIANLIFGGAAQYDQWLRDTLVATPALVAILVPLFIRARWAQIAGAAVSAALATYFLAIATTVAII